MRRMHRPEAGNAIAKIAKANVGNPLGEIRRSTGYAARSGLSVDLLVDLGVGGNRDEAH